MPFQSVKIDKYVLSNAIAEMYTGAGKNVDEIIDFLASKNQRSAVWFDISKLIVGADSDPRRIARYPNKSYKYFVNHKDAVKELVESKLEDKSIGISKAKEDTKNKIQGNVAKFKGIVINGELLANAILQKYNDTHEDVQYVIDFLISQDKDEQIWYDIAKQIVGIDRDIRTIKRYQIECSKYFQDHKDDIKDLVSVGFRNRNTVINNIQPDTSDDEKVENGSSMARRDKNNNKADKVVSKRKTKTVRTTSIENTVTKMYQNVSGANILFKDSNYPAGFPYLSKAVNGYVIDEIGFKTLNPYQDHNQWVDDAVINCFFSILPEIAMIRLGTPLLCFDTMFYEKILLQKTISMGFIRWASKEEVMKKNIWFLPINIRGNHWTLLVIVLNQHVMIFFDSLLKKPNAIIINAIATLIQNESKSEINWEDWTLFIPKDIPEQKLSSRYPDVIGGNCGIHVCVRGLILATNTPQDYKEEQMDQVRKGLANMLVHYKPNESKSKKTVENRKYQYLGKDEIERRTKILPLFKKINVDVKQPLHLKCIQDFTSGLHVGIQPLKERTNTRKKVVS